MPATRSSVRNWLWAVMFAIRFFLFCGTTFHIGYRPASSDPGCSQYAVQLVWGLTFSVANLGIYTKWLEPPKVMVLHANCSDQGSEQFVNTI